MQNEMSKKLDKIVLSPNERVVQRDNFFIVTKGKVDVCTQKRRGTRLCYKKYLRTVERNPDKEVYSNVFGYVPLFTGRPSRLSAVSKDFSVCYSVDFEAFLDTMRDDHKDFEYYFQTKHKLELERFPELYEIPNLINNRQHYCPVVTYVLRRYKNCQKVNQERDPDLDRRGRRMKIMCIVEKAKKDEEQSDNSSAESVIVSPKINQKQSVDSKTKNMIASSSLASLRRTGQKGSKITLRSYRRKNYKANKNDFEDKFQELRVQNFLDHDLIQTSKFQVAKDYMRYYTKGNHTKVIKRFNKDLIKDFHDKKEFKKTSNLGESRFFSHLTKHVLTYREGSI